MRKIVVGQRSLEQGTLEYAASELWQQGDAPITLVHVAGVLPPQATVLHSAPHTVFEASSGDVDQRELYAKVCKAIQVRVLSCAEALGVPVELQVKLEPSERPANDTADIIIQAARELGASMLVVAHEAKPVEAQRPTTPRARLQQAVAAGVQQAGGALERLLAGGGDSSAPLSGEVISRSGSLPVVLVPVNYSERRLAAATGPGAAADSAKEEAAAPSASENAAA